MLINDPVKLFNPSEATYELKSCGMKDPSIFYFHLIHNASGYSVNVHMGTGFDNFRPAAGSDVTFASPEGILITSRELERYDNFLFHLDFMTPKPQQFTVVGPGLGVLVHALGEQQAALEGGKTPFAIDLAPYPLLAEILGDLGCLDLGERYNEKIAALKRRCQALVDSQQVRLINLSLEKALASHPEIVGTADVVVDHIGAMTYACHVPSSCDGTHPRIYQRDLLLKLAKEGGTVLAAHQLPDFTERKKGDPTLGTTHGRKKLW